MDSILPEILKQVPALAVLAGVVYTFLKFMRQADSDRLEAFRDITKDFHRLEDRSIAAMDRNTEVLGAVKSTLDRMNGVAKL